jgi:hypothetical protein
MCLHCFMPKTLTSDNVRFGLLQHLATLRWEKLRREVGNVSNISTTLGRKGEISQVKAALDFAEASQKVL